MTCTRCMKNVRDAHHVGNGVYLCKKCSKQVIDELFTRLAEVRKLLEKNRSK